MLATGTTESASNWDFTQVFDILKSPTYGFNARFAQEVNRYCSPSSDGHSTHGLTPSANSRPDEIKRQRSYPKLGDFGLIWDLLNKDSPSPNNNLMPEEPPSPSFDQHSTLTILRQPVHDEPAKGTISIPHKSVPVVKLSTPSVTKEKDLNRSSRNPPPLSQQPISILKRAAGGHPIENDVTATSSPQTLPRATGHPSKPTEIPNVNNRTKDNGKVTKSQVSPEPILSESSTGVYSDSSAVVFDQPITKKSGVLLFVPTQVGSRDARGHHEGTPPSSYDEADWGFASNTTSNTAQNLIITSAGIQVLPAAYETASERRFGLVTMLLRDFPEYAQLASQVLTKKSVEPRPIHVFVDMSNVCFLPVLTCHSLPKLTILSRSWWVSTIR